jgi:DGQHR domain-containing protein
MYITQSNKIKILQVRKKVDWLVENTEIKVFDPINFEGYQRQIDSNHCSNIVKYIQKDFILPTSIICATDYVYNDKLKLRIVDGQHRIKAFQDLKESNPTRFNEVKDYEMSVIVLEEATELQEIDTFITINKTSKKVDTSLAYILKNKLNNSKNSKDLSISKREFIAVELAIKLSEKSEIWKDKILFEGSVKNTDRYISLNAFVKSTRSLLFSLERKKLIDLKWENEIDIKKCLEELFILFEYIWNIIKFKWEGLFSGDKFNRTIIQGAIGFSTINKLISYQIKNSDEINTDILRINLKKWIMIIDVPTINWMPGGKYSKFTSESGYSIVANDLRNSMF